MSVVLIGSSELPGEPCDPDCGPCDEVTPPPTTLVAHRLIFSKGWYGYPPFTTTGSDIITTVYRTFTITIVDTVNGFTTIGTVTFNRLNGHPSLTITTDALDGIDSVMWPPSRASILGEIDPGEITATQVGPFDLGDSIHLVTWALSDAYTLEELEEDVDDMAALYEAGDPAVPDYFDNEVTIQYNGSECCEYTCLFGQIGEPGFPNCRFTSFSDSEFYFFPESKARYDAQLGGVSPVIRFTTTGIGHSGYTLQSGNAVSMDLIAQFAGVWNKSKLLVQAYPWPPLCATTAINSTVETVADVCITPVPSGADLRFDPPPSRAIDNLQPADAWAVTQTLCYNCVQVASTCPCYTPTLAWFDVSAFQFGTLQINGAIRWHTINLLRGNATKARVWVTDARGNTNLKAALYNSAGTVLLAEGHVNFISSSDLSGPTGGWVEVPFDAPAELLTTQDCILAIIASDGDLDVAHTADLTGFVSSAFLYSGFAPASLPGSFSSEVKISMGVFVE